MNTELKNAVKATDSKAQYDTSAKRLLGQKSILAHILVKTVDEFKGMNPKDVVNCIEGTPHISTVPVEPGLTNAASEKNGERLGVLIPSIFHIICTGACCSCPSCSKASRSGTGSIPFACSCTFPIYRILMLL